MPRTFSILNRYTNEVLYSGEHESLKEAVEAAVKTYADLRYADLGYANLGSADLRYADLGYANLGYADLRYADLGYANLGSAKINWQSHALISRILLDAAGNSIGKRKVAGLVLVSTDWCWEEWLSLRRSRHFSWAIDTLATFVQEGDGAPKILVERAASLKAATVAPPVGESKEQP
jgi:hypothetical protein